MSLLSLSFIQNYETIIFLSYIYISVIKFVYIGIHFVGPILKKKLEKRNTIVTIYSNKLTLAPNISMVKLAKVLSAKCVILLFCHVQYFRTWHVPCWKLGKCSYLFCELIHRDIIFKRSPTLGASVSLFKYIVTTSKLKQYSDYGNL